MYYDSQCYVMQCIVVVFCFFFLVLCDLMCEVVDLVCYYGVLLYMYLVENVNDIVYSCEKFNMILVEYVEDCGWVGYDVWYVYCVQLDEYGIDLFVCIGMGVVYCFCFNMWLVFGIVFICKMLDVGVLVGLGVDGSVFNDSVYMLGEVCQVMLLQWVGFGFDVMIVCQVLEVVMLGGVKVLNCDDIGVFKLGMLVDVVMFDMCQIVFVGVLYDLVVVFVFCIFVNVNISIINGCVIVCEGQFIIIDLGVVLEWYNYLVYQLVEVVC